MTGRYPFRWNDFLGLYQVSKVRTYSPDNYFAFQKFQGDMLVRYLASRGISLAGKRLLDLGCGPAGYSAAFAASGARVVSIDLSPNRNYRGNPSVAADAFHIPCQEGQFDIVVCASLIEHVPQPEKLIDEILRVLDTNGNVYLSFPPYYSPVGGHQFAPFHLLGQKLAIRLARKVGKLRNHEAVSETVNAHSENFQEAFDGWGLYILTIRKVKRLLKQRPVRIREQSTRWLPLDFSHIPYLGEFLTWHVQFIVSKR